MSNSVFAKDLAQDIMKSGHLASFGFTEERLAVLIDEKLSEVRETMSTLLKGAVIPQVLQKRRMIKVWESIKVD